MEQGLPGGNFPPGALLINKKNYGMNRSLHVFPAGLIALCLIISSSVTGKAQEGDPAWVKQVGARAFPNGKASFRVNDYGADGQGKTLCTHSIQQAIDDCAAKGGGIVEFAAGIYLTGAIFIRTGVELRISKGVELQG